MRKLKLQVQLSLDGCLAGNNDEMDWMTMDWDDELKAYVAGLTEEVDTILLGRKMVDGFIESWSGLLNNPAGAEFAFAKKMIDTPKVVFSKTLQSSAWKNTTLAKGDLAEAVQQLKTQKGKDIMVYGGALFNGSLISAGLIDEYHLFINPVAIGEGKSIFSKLNKYLELTLKQSIAFDCGVVLLKYEPRRS